MSGSGELVWYAAYGSNLHFARFVTYLTGGTAPGASWSQNGARDPRPPRADSPCWLRHRLYFAGPSRWGGGVAALDPELVDPAPTRARRYLLTVEQFEDVVVQESGVGGSVDLAGLREAGRARRSGTKYGLLLYAGEVDDIPVVTFTTDRRRSAAVHTPPTVPYRQRIVDGLIESHDIDERVAAAYVDDHID